MSLRPLLLMLRPLGLGDFLTGVPAYRALARTFPAHRRLLLAPKPLHALVPLVEAMDGAVDLAAMKALPSELCAADIAVNLHGSGPESHRTLLAAHPRRLIAFRNDEISQSRDGAAWRAGEHEVVRWCRMLAHHGIAVDPDDLELRRPRPVGRTVVDATIVHPGAASAARRWPIERWAEVARFCVRAGERVLITGGPHEKELTEEVASRAGLSRAHALGACTTLAQLASIVAHATCVICSDTGMGHLATALRIPSVVLFGPIPPSEWGPPPQRSWHRALWSGRRGDPHGETVDPGLLSIAPRDVFEQLERLPRRAGVPASGGQYSTV